MLKVDSPICLVRLGVVCLHQWRARFLLPRNRQAGWAWSGSADRHRCGLARRSSLATSTAVGEIRLADVRLFKDQFKSALDNHSSSVSSLVIFVQVGSDFRDLLAVGIMDQMKIKWQVIQPTLRNMLLAMWWYSSLWFGSRLYLLQRLHKNVIVSNTWHSYFIRIPLRVLDYLWKVEFHELESANQISIHLPNLGPTEQ